MALTILCIVFGGYFLWKMYRRIDTFGDTTFGEEAPFITDVNLFLMSHVFQIWGTFWLCKLIAIVAGKEFNIFSYLDAWMVSIVALTFVGGYLSLSASTVFGWLSLILVFWPLVPLIL